MAHDYYTLHDHTSRQQQHRALVVAPPFPPAVSCAATVAGDAEAGPAGAKKEFVLFGCCTRSVECTTGVDRRVLHSCSVASCFRGLLLMGRNSARTLRDPVTTVGRYCNRLTGRCVPAPPVWTCGETETGPGGSFHRARRRPHGWRRRSKWPCRLWNAVGTMFPARAPDEAT